MRRMSHDASALIRSKVEALAADPHAANNNVRALVGMVGTYRLRVQDWRVIYRVLDA